MPNRRYEKGARFERRVVNYLKADGFNAARTAGSKSPVDVVGWGNNEVYFIQCKAYVSGKPTKKDFEKLRRAATVSGPQIRFVMAYVAMGKIVFAYP